MAAGRDRGRHSGFSRGDQGAPDYTGRRRNSLLECGVAATFGFVFVRAAGPLFSWRSLSRAGAGKDGCFYLSREYRGRVHRDRMEIRIAGSEEVAGVFEQRNVEGRQEAD